MIAILVALVLTLRVPAVNLRSGMQMPTNIPQIAIDKSKALDTLSADHPFPTPPGQNRGQGQVNRNIRT